MKSQWRAHGMTIVLVMAMAALTGCGSGNAGSTTPAPAPAGTAPDVPFDSVESKLPSIGVPKIVAGTQCSIGYQNVFAAVPALKAEQDAAQKEAERLGCSFMAVDDQAAPVNQVNHMNQFIAQKVNAIIVFPNVSSALAPSVSQAVSHGIFVLGQNAPPQADVAPLQGYSTNGVQGVDTETYMRVKSIAQKSPGVSFAVMGLAAPVQVVTYYTDRTKYWAERFGLNFLGQVDAQSDDPAGQATAMSAILARYPKTQALFTYNDTAAVSASSIAGSSGKTILISGGDGSTNAINAIKSGRVFNTVQPQILTRGPLLVDAAYDLITKQNLPLPKTFGVPVTLITQENAGSVTPVG